MAILSTVIIGGVAAAACAGVISTYRQRVQRERHIRAYMFPRGLFEKFAQARPGLDVKQQQLVARGMRQFFLTYHKSGYKRVSMPSQVVDDFWHEFILFTRDYQRFCDAAFGRFLHHTPAARLGPARSSNEGLRRVWWYACLEENINPRKPTRLPLLFALDRKLGIQGGFSYFADCRYAPSQVREGAASGGQCGTDFSSADWDGSTDGFGDGPSFEISANTDGDVSGGGDGGCGGGCGGD